uniref:(northern house mosquito) hypothetical protein n=1 Tax=Culex pipiens TaxID=7175 RepID=A0A8D8F956_CULPI
MAAAAVEFMISSSNWASSSVSESNRLVDEKRRSVGSFTWSLKYTSIRLKNGHSRRFGSSDILMALYSCSRLFHFLMIFEIGKGTLSSRSTTAHAYLDAFRLPVKSGDSSARSRIRVFTLSASQQYLIDWQFCVGVAGVELPMLLLLLLLLLWLLPLMMLPFPFPIGPPPFWVTIIPPPLLTIPTTPPILFPILLTIVLPPEFIDRDIPGSHTHQFAHGSSLHSTTLS